MKEIHRSAIERRESMQAELAQNPFLSDDQLAGILNVSIHTIRADRHKIGIPEVRKRGNDFSHSLYAQAKTLSQQEIVGELLEIELDKSGLSLLETTPQMGLEKSGIIRGHVLFAQANTLANAIVDAEVALTGEAEIRYIAPIYAGERILAKALVVGSRRHTKRVQVVIKTKEKKIFEGFFTIHCLDKKLASHFHNESKTKKKEKS